MARARKRKYYNVCVAVDEVDMGVYAHSMDEAKQIAIDTFKLSMSNVRAFVLSWQTTGEDED